MTEGWVCPKCGSVYAPFVMKCEQCCRRIVVSDESQPCTCGTTMACPIHGIQPPRYPWVQCGAITTDESPMVTVNGELTC